MQVLKVPAGTEIKVRLDTQLDTGETQAGQIFTGTVAEPVVVGGKTVLVQGAAVSGRVTEVVSSGRLKRPAAITLELTRVGGAAMPAQPLHIDGKSHLLRNVALIGGGTGTGAAVGGVTGGKKGAAVGAAIGAGAGTAVAYLTGKKEIVLPAETVLPFVASDASTQVATTAAARSAPEPSRKATEAAQAYRDEGGGAGAGKVRHAAESLLFNEHDQQIIRSYFRGGQGLPPGLAKRGGKLPPGLEKHLQRNGTLPPGLQKRIQPFPSELSQQLPRLPTGYSRVFLAGRALILDRNHKILDLMALAQ
jgi:hypothetical protein